MAALWPGYTPNGPTPCCLSDHFLSPDSLTLERTENERRRNKNKAKNTVDVITLGLGFSCFYLEPKITKILPSNISIFFFFFFALAFSQYMWPRWFISWPQKWHCDFGKIACFRYPLLPFECRDGPLVQSKCAKLCNLKITNSDREMRQSIRICSGLSSPYFFCKDFLLLFFSK